MKSIAIVLVVFFISGSWAPEKKPVCLNKEEKKLYALIMEYRKSKNLKSIPLSGKLTQVAQLHAKDLSSHYQYSPTNPCNPHSWSGNGNWTACCYTNDHKQARCMWEKPMEITEYEGNGYEIAYYSSGGANAEEGLAGWKKSPGHNPLLINLGTWKNITWKAIGIGFYKEYGVVWFGENEDVEQASPCPQP